MKSRKSYEEEPPRGRLPPLAQVIARYGLQANKSLGQNFLLDLNLTRKIARSVPALKSSTIYEIGPGPGGLTRALLMEGAPFVIAVEKDRRCQAALGEVTAGYKNRLRVIEADALKIDELKILRGADLPVRVASNLPYNIGTALLIKWLTIEPWPAWFSSLNLMFQR
ncbi:MAG: rRNA adenine N-6-methyltransferase family protein, partial [Sphingomonadales bacterium]